MRRERCTGRRNSLLPSFLAGKVRPTGFSNKGFDMKVIVAIVAVLITCAIADAACGARGARSGLFRPFQRAHERRMERRDMKQQNRMERRGVTVYVLPAQAPEKIGAPKK